MNPVAGKRLLLILFSSILLWQQGRVNHLSGDSPAFCIQEGTGPYIWLGEGFDQQGVRQFSDDVLLEDVISLTHYSLERLEVRDAELKEPVFSGEKLSFECDFDGRCRINRVMMTSAQRMAMGIPLHPDRMEREDWLSLKGIGPVLAEQIEQDRQINGDFGILESLQRVKGIGKKKIENWKPFF